MTYVEQLLESDEQDIDWEEEMKKHLVQIQFFAHERLIHLIVTVLFAIMTMSVFLYAMDHFSWQILLLIAALMVLLVPYIRHYFLLENSVQDMYEQYDRMRGKVGRAFRREGKYKR